jgi:hypothetical protein
MNATRARDHWGLEYAVTYTDTEGQDYEVPCYRCRRGQSVNAVAALLGGTCLPPSQWSEAIASRRAIAAIVDGGLTRPVVSLQVMPQIIREKLAVNVASGLNTGH